MPEGMPMVLPSHGMRTRQPASKMLGTDLSSKRPGSQRNRAVVPDFRTIARAPLHERAGAFAASVPPNRVQDGRCADRHHGDLCPTRAAMRAAPRGRCPPACKLFPRANAHLRDRYARRRRRQVGTIIRIQTSLSWDNVADTEAASGTSRAPAAAPR
jgi:hypothetical protein